MDKYIFCCSDCTSDAKQFHVCIWQNHSVVHCWIGVLANLVGCNKEKQKSILAMVRLAQCWFLYDVDLICVESHSQSVYDITRSLNGK